MDPTVLDGGVLIALSSSDDAHHERDGPNPLPR
jgi:hypothetical protein